MSAELAERQRLQQLSATISEQVRRSPVLSGVHRAVESSPLHADSYIHDLLAKLATGQVTTLVLGGLPGSGKSTILGELTNLLHKVRPDLPVETLSYSDMRAKVQKDAVEQTGEKLGFADERTQATGRMTKELVEHAKNPQGKVFFAEMVILPVTDPQTREVLDRGISTLGALVPYAQAGQVVVPFLGPDPATMVVGTSTRGKQSKGGDPDMLLRLQFGAFEDSQRRQEQEPLQRKQERARGIRFPQGMKMQDMSSLETGREIAQCMLDLLRARGIDSRLNTVVWNPMNPRYSRHIRRCH